MKIKFTRHALDRIRSRGITKREAKEAVLNGQTWDLQVHGTIRRAYKSNGHTLVVIYEQLKDHFNIITAYYEN